MNFDLTEDQKMLVETVASFVKKASPVSRLRSLREDPIGWSPAVWRQMGEFGWLGVMLPETLGGVGGSFVDASLILTELGAALVPEPYLPSLVAAIPLLRAGSAEQQQRWLAPLGAGQSSLALAYAETQSRANSDDVTLRAVREGDSYVLSGDKRFVLNGHAADQIVVSARTSGGPRDTSGISLFVVDRDTPGLTVRPVKTMDGHHAALLHFEQLRVAEDRRLGDEGAGAPLLAEALDVGAAACCAEGVGIMRTLLWMTCDYLRTREQFGVKIGTFQALQHRAVDMFVESELCKSSALEASIRVSDGSPPDVRESAISAAKVQLAWGGRYVSQQAIQLHGGIGVTDEHDVGLYFKRMHILNTLFGDQEHHLHRYAHGPHFTAGVES
jgi:alkylation response protein AidB-like acyl-CoA dehydrogenase